MKNSTATIDNIADVFLDILDRCNEPGTHRVAIRFGPEPLLMLSGNKFPIEHCKGFIVIEDPGDTGKRLHFSYDKLNRPSELIKIISFDFADTPQKSILADLPKEPVNFHSPTIYNASTVKRLFLTGDFRSNSCLFTFQIAFIELGPTGGEGGILLSKGIFGQRQMRSLTRLLLEGGAQVD